MHPNSSRWPLLRNGALFCLSLGILLVVGSSAAIAGFSVTIYVDGVQLPTIFDNSPGNDLNNDEFDMTVPFTVGDIGNNWTASGVIYANGGGGVPPVSTIVTDTLIEKLTPGFYPGEIRVVHNYAASGAFSHTGELDGQFENTLGNLIGNAQLTYTAKVSGQNLGFFQMGPISGVLFQPFNDNFGPLLLPTTTEHSQTFDFYLDSVGDAIRLFNSAEIHTVVPEPSSAVLGAVGAALILTWAGRSRKRPPRMAKITG